MGGCPSGSRARGDSRERRNVAEPKLFLRTTFTRRQGRVMRNRLTSFALASTIAVLTLGHPWWPTTATTTIATIARMAIRASNSGRGRSTSSTTWTAAAQEQAEPVQAGRSTRPTSRSATAARRCSSPSTPSESYNAAARMGAGIVECDVDLHQGQGTGLPPRAVRPAHHHQHPGHAAGRQVHAAVHAGAFDAAGSSSSRRAPSAAPATSRWPSSRRCAARWTPSTRARARRPSTWAARRAGAPTSTPADAARC